MQIEFSYFIPPDVTINSDGTIDDINDAYSFNDQQMLIEKSFTGYGMPGIEYITQQGPYQNGVTVLDYRLQPRVIQLVHRVRGSCRQDYWDNRANLMNFLRPNRQLPNSFKPGRLRRILPDGTVRDLKVFIDSGPRFNPRSVDEWDEFSFEETLRFIAHDPVLFDPETQSAIWDLESFSNLIFYEPVNWENRLVFEGDSLDSGGIWFGEDSINQTINVTYNGTWLDYPTIIITGPIDNPRIYNNTTDEKIELEYNVSVGETVTINLDYGIKTVVNNVGTNLIGTVTTDSDISTFHIAPDPEAPGGVNELQVVGDGAVAGQTEVRIEYNESYIGI